MPLDFFERIVRDEIQDFIMANELADVQKLLLKKNITLGVPTVWVAQQILGRRKAKTKLPHWYNTHRIVYPPSLNLEQCSSEATARFKKSLAMGNHGVDLTGGFGVDSYFLSQATERLDYVESDGELLQIARHNHSLLGAHNIVYHHTSAQEFLSSLRSPLDFCYVDPSRRKESRKVIRLSDCTPDITTLMPKLLGKSIRVLVKTSPLMDLRHAWRHLPGAYQLMVLSFKDECKELLVTVGQDFHNEPLIRAIDLDGGGNPLISLSFTWSEEKEVIPVCSEPLAYLFEPASAILKAGGFNWVAKNYPMKKIAPHTHLYTSEKVTEKFPGRIFKVLAHVNLNSKLKSKFANGYANILTRNFPLSVEEVKKKTGLKEGGALYLICTQNEKKRFAIMAERVK